MKVLDCVHALQALPILEPHIVLHFGRKRLLYKRLNLRLGRCCRLSRDWIILQVKLGPDDEVDDVRVKAVRPVVVEDLHVLGILERPALGLQRLPPQALLEHEVENTAIISD